MMIKEAGEHEYSPYSASKCDDRLGGGPNNPFGGFYFIHNANTNILILDNIGKQKGYDEFSSGLAT